MCTQKTDWKTACNNRIKFPLWLLLNYLFISATSDAHTDDWTVFQGQRKIKCFTFLVSKSPLCTWWMPSKHHQHQAGKRQAQARVQTRSSERQVELLTRGQVLSSTGSVRSAATAFHVRWWLNHRQGYDGPKAAATTLHLIFQQTGNLICCGKRKESIN